MLNDKKKGMIMNKKLCFYTPPFPRVKSYYDMIDVAAEYGLTAVEGFSCYEFETPDENAAMKIREYADSKNIIFPCFSVFTKLASDKGSVEMLKKYARIAKIMGSPYLHHTIVGECQNSEQVLSRKDDLFRTGIEAVREIYDYAESIGIKAIYEEQGYIFNGIKNFGEFLEKVDREVGVVADFGNIYESEDNLIDFLKAFAHKVVHVHLKDVRLSDTNYDGQGFDSTSGKYMYEAEFGKGIVNLKDAIGILKDAGYEGYYGLEFSASENDSPIIAQSIKLIEDAL